MEIFAICAVAAMAAFLALAVKPQRPEIALALGTAAGIGIVLAALTRLIPAIESINRLLELAALQGEFIGTLFKGLGICLLTQLTSDICKDAGENGLAAKTELAGKAMLLVLATPLFVRITELALALIRGEGTP